MRNRTLVILTIVTACGIISAAYGQMLDTKPADKQVTPGINKIPPLLPVMSAGDFQSKVKSLSNDNRSAMTKQGLDTIQQQRDAIPVVKPGDPPPLPPTKTPDSEKSSSQTTAKQPPASAQAPVPAAGNTEQPDTGTEETEDSDASNEPAPSSPVTRSPGNTPTPNSSPPPSGGGLNIQY